jgi:hypothetical protein
VVSGLGPDEWTLRQQLKEVSRGALTAGAAMELARDLLGFASDAWLEGREPYEGAAAANLYYTLAARDPEVCGRVWEALPAPGGRAADVEAIQKRCDDLLPSLVTSALVVLRDAGDAVLIGRSWERGHSAAAPRVKLPRWRED